MFSLKWMIISIIISLILSFSYKLMFPEQVEQINTLKEDYWLSVDLTSIDKLNYLKLDNYTTKEKYTLNVLWVTEKTNIWNYTSEEIKNLLKTEKGRNILKKIWNTTKSNSNLENIKWLTNLLK